MSVRLCSLYIFIYHEASRDPTLASTAWQYGSEARRCRVNLGKVIHVFALFLRRSSSESDMCKAVVKLESMVPRSGTDG